MRGGAAAALALAAAGLLGVLPGARGAWDGHACLTWLALVAPALGVLAGSLRAPLALVAAPAAWTLAVLACGSEPGLPRPWLGLVAIAGTFLIGAAVGTRLPRRRYPLAGLALLATGALAALPAGGGRMARPWPAPVAARLLDASPVGLALECAGADWLRHPAVYEPVGAADIDPSLRVAWSGALAAPVVFVVGCGLVVAARRSRARATDRAAREPAR